MPITICYERTRGTVQTKAGSLLEHFAQLAANVAGTSAAVVGVLGRRQQQVPTLAAFGLSRDRSSLAVEIDRILDSGSSLTVVPDLAQDERFAAWVAALEQPPPRFLGHHKLLAPGGRRIGFVCVLDQDPRPGLTDAEAASLGYVASMIVADRKREQRHLHLMHVADRALRVDRMLRLVSEAASCADALTNLLEELCRFHGASVGRIWQLAGSNGSMREISRYDRDDAGTDDGVRPVEPTIALNAMTIETIRRNQPHASTLSQPGAGAPPEHAVPPGFPSQVCIPIWVQQQRFGISLAFDTEHPDLDSVMADIASLGDTIKPALFRKVTEERIRFAAHHDDLTQLSNRLKFQECLRSTLAAARSGEHAFAVLYLDLDAFKSVNDTRGHEVGDQILVAVAERLRDSVREGDTIGRMGGDEFAIIQPFGSQPSAATALAERLLETFGRPFDLAGRHASIGVSIGIALYPQDGDTPDLLLRSADTALYRAKQAGRSTFCLFHPTMGSDGREHSLREQDLRAAIEAEQFRLEYQPVCDAHSLRVVGFEALLRWSNPASGPIQPERFIPLAETNGLITRLGQWALGEACAEAATWSRAVCLSVNLSPLQFRQPDLPRRIADILDRAGLPAERLYLEVTEGLLLEESEQVLRTMRGLREQGVRITLDDFGTAYASLSYLRRFPFDGIKIDQSFIRGLSEDDGTLAIVQAILSLGERLNLTVVAEGVETERELDTLRKLGCRLVQGYLSGKPLEAGCARALLGRVAASAGHCEPYPAAVE